jgi:hypothetical protein
VKKKATCFCSFVLIMLSVISVPLFRADALEHSSSSPGANPLVEEMQLLDKAFQEIVSAVALGDGQRVRKALEPLQGVMEKTHEGVQSGTVNIPRKPHRVKEFIKLDKKFHTGLEALEHAAQKNNQQKMLSLTKKLLDECVNCHRTFRK